MTHAHPAVQGMGLALTQEPPDEGMNYIWCCFVHRFS